MVEGNENGPRRDQYGSYQRFCEFIEGVVKMSLVVSPSVVNMMVSDTAGENVLHLLANDDVSSLY